MKPIGGYFGLELPKGSQAWHDSALCLKSGRSSLHYILTIIKPSLVYLPFYTCDALLEPFKVSGVQYRFYEINQLLEPSSLPVLKEKEYFIYINYFDLKRAAVARLSEQLGDKLIVDCTQAFFLKGNGRSWFFNSCRKFFGVPDGSFLYAPGGTVLPGINTMNENYTVDHLLKRFNGHAREGYASFQQNEVLCGTDIALMSALTQQLLSNVNYRQVMDTRRSNFVFLYNILNGVQQMRLEPDTESVPMSYPLLLTARVNRNTLQQNDVFVPMLWKDVADRNERGFEFERSLSERLLPLPVDQRYHSGDMMEVVNVLKNMQ